MCALDGSAAAAGRAAIAAEASGVVCGAASLDVSVGERLREFVGRFDRADDVTLESQVELTLTLLRRAREARGAAA